MSGRNVDEMQPIGADDNEKEKREKLNCNGEMPRTFSEPSTDGSTSINRGRTEHADSTEATSCGSLAAQWVRDEQAVSNSKDPSCNNHNSDNTSSEDETEGEEGEFSANWYVPLPQDPQQSDEEEGEDGEQWSGAATGATLQSHQDEDDELKGQGASTRAEEIKPSSQMEDSQVEAIKQAMAGFTLPLGSQPQWAKVVPENVWKAELIGGLRHKQEQKSKAKTKQKKT